MSGMSLASGGDSTPFKLVGGQQYPLQVSKNDDRDYRFLQLENGLRVLLVHDVKTDMSAAALSVSVGSMHDPDSLQGAFHFLEHMLFLGTEKYPDENAYSQYLNDHAGSSNAYTASQETNYHFQVAPDALKGALDRFSGFFTCPLFTESATDREMQAVDSEHAKNIQQDMWRFYQLDKSTSRPGHPYTKFGTGDSRTLRDQPAQEGRNVREELLQLHKAHYSAGRMALVVLGRETLETLESWAREFFSSVPNNGSNMPVEYSHPYEGRLGIKHIVVPVKDLRSLLISWPMPEQRTVYKQKPGRYLSHLLGHEGPGSLLSHLKARGWALELSAGAFDSEAGYSTFTVDISLTDDGLQHTEEIAAILYAYVGMLRAKGPRHWICQEIAEQASASFRFQNKSSPFGTVQTYARYMHEGMAVEHTLSGPHLYWDYAPELIQAQLDLMTPHKSRVRVVSQTLSGQAPLREKWYGTEYGEEQLDQQLLTRWEQAAAVYQAFVLSGCALPTSESPAESPAASWPSAPWAESLFPSLTLPAPNEFLATDFSLRHPRLAERELSATTAPAAGAAAGAQPLRLPVPVLLQDDQEVELWWHMDDYFAVPKAFLVADVILPAGNTSPASAVMLDLFLRLLKEALNEFAYNASIAGLQYSLTAVSQGIHLEVGGFSHKLAVLVARIGQKMAELSFTDREFEVQKDACTRQYANFSKESAYQHAISATTTATTSPRWHHSEKLSVIPSVTAEDVRRFQKQLLSGYFLRVLASGNVNSEEALAVAAALLKPLSSTGKPLFPSEHPLPRVCSLPFPISITSPEGKAILLSPEFTFSQPAPNAEDPNAAMELICQVGEVAHGEHCRQTALVSLLGHLLSEPFFDTLRTKQQLGYITFAGVKEEWGVQALRFIVQSTKVPAAELVARTEAFLADFTAQLGEMSEERFQSNVQAVVAKKSQADKQPAHEASRLFTEIGQGSLNFKRFVYL